MYDLIDRPAAHLNRSGSVILLAMRLWARRTAAGKCSCVELRAMFDAHGFRSSTEPFRLFMAALQGGARRNISFYHPNCPEIGEDEAVLLALIRRPRTPSARNLEVATNLVVGARLPQFVQGLKRLSDSLADCDGGPRIVGASQGGRLSGGRS